MKLQKHWSAQNHSNCDFAANDLMALGALNAIEEEGLLYPRILL